MSHTRRTVTLSSEDDGTIIGPLARDLTAYRLLRLGSMVHSLVLEPARYKTVYLITTSGLVLSYVDGALICDRDYELVPWFIASDMVRLDDLAFTDMYILVRMEEGHEAPRKMSMTVSEEPHKDQLYVRYWQTLGTIQQMNSLVYSCGQVVRVYDHGYEVDAFWRK